MLLQIDRPFPGGVQITHELQESGEESAIAKPVRADKTTIEIDAVVFTDVQLERTLPDNKRDKEIETARISMEDKDGVTLILRFKIDNAKQRDLVRSFKS